MTSIKNGLFSFLFGSFFCFLAWADESKQISYPSISQVGAQLRLRPELRDNTDFGGSRTYSLLRFRANAAFNISPEALIYIQPQFSKFMGEATFLGNSISSNVFQATSGVFFDSALTVHQAYLDYRPFEGFQMIGGRQILSYGDEVLVGAAMGWANVGRSFDGIKFVYQRPTFRSDLFWTRLFDSSTFFKSGTGNADFGGFYNTFDLGPIVKNFDLYTLYLSDSRAANSLSLWSFGTRLKSSLDVFDYRFESTYQVGTLLGREQNGNQADFELGYKLDSKSNMRVSALGFYASPNFNQLFPAGHKWLGIADVVGRRNIVGGSVKFAANPVSRLNFTCEVFKFYRASTDAPAYTLTGSTALGSVSKSSASDIGTELDVNLYYYLNNSIHIGTGVNTLFAADYLVQNFGNINPTYAFLELEAKY